MTRELSIRLLFTVVTRAAIVLFFFFLFDFIYFEQYKLWYIDDRISRNAFFIKKK